MASLSSSLSLFFFFFPLHCSRLPLPIRIEHCFTMELVGRNFNTRGLHLFRGRQVKRAVFEKVPVSLASPPLILAFFFFFWTGACPLTNLRRSVPVLHLPNGFFWCVTVLYTFSCPQGSVPSLLGRHSLGPFLWSSISLTFLSPPKSKFFLLCHLCSLRLSV